MEEKRRFVRLDMNTDVNWRRVVPPPIIKDKRDQTKNISEGGICLIVYERVVIKDQLELDIELPNGKIIHVKGQVAWVQEFEIKGKGKRYDAGIEFLDISSQDRDEIKKFVFRI